MVGLGDQLLHGGDQQLLAFMIDTQKDVDLGPTVCIT